MVATASRDSYAVSAVLVIGGRSEPFETIDAARGYGSASASAWDDAHVPSQLASASSDNCRGCGSVWVMSVSGVG